MRREHFLPAVTVVLLALLLCGGGAIPPHDVDRRYRGSEAVLK